MGKLEAIARLEEIKEEMQALLLEASHLVRQYAGERSISDRAHAYWVPHIEQALETTGYDTDMTGTIKEMEESIEEEPAEAE